MRSDPPASEPTSGPPAGPRLGPTAFAGVHTAIVTPFRDDKVDFAALERVVERQIAGGIHGLVPCGTTGESSTLSAAEKLEVIAATVRFAAGRCKVIAGVGTNDTAASLLASRKALDVGADAGLVITPYYNKPTPAGLYHHFRTLAEGVPDLPFVLYNVPSRTSVSFDVATVERLADLPNVVALKEATGDLKFDAKLVSAVGDRMILLSGDDATAFPLWCVGGRGLIAVITNLIPDRVVSMWQAFERGDLAAARRMHLQMMPLFEGLFIETSPGPVKAVLSWMEKGIRPDMRLPLVPIEAATERRLRALCEQLEVPLVD